MSNENTWYAYSGLVRKDDYYETKTLKFIWGIKSADDISNSPCCLHTMNDFSITYYKNIGKYYIEFDRLYRFESGYDGEKRYINDIFKKLTKWMDDNGYDTNKQIDLYQFGRLSIDEGFNSIEDAYTAFKYFVKGY